MLTLAIPPALPVLPQATVPDMSAAAYLSSALATAGVSAGHPAQVQFDPSVLMASATAAAAAAAPPGEGQQQRQGGGGGGRRRQQHSGDDDEEDEDEEDDDWRQPWHHKVRWGRQAQPAHASACSPACPPAGMEKKFGVCGGICGPARSCLLHACLCLCLHITRCCLLTPARLPPPHVILLLVQGRERQGGSSARPQRQRKKSRLLQEYLTDEEGEEAGDGQRGRRTAE